MGHILKEYQFKLSESANLMKPIIFCKPPKEIEDIAVSVNIALAKEFKMSTRCQVTLRKS